ncbi:MAG: hypothetical protein ACI857_000705 [Arenicella sp.]|jgi:hypothetical protein
MPAHNYIELNCYCTWLGSDRIARTKVKERAIVVLQDAIENSICVNRLIPSSFGLIVDAGGVKPITKKAREHFAGRGRSSKCLSIAILLDSPLNRMGANFYMGVSKPDLPVKLFNSQNKAINSSKSQS